jgi:hypothetical protein
MIIKFKQTFLILRKKMIIKFENKHNAKCKE